VLFLGSRRAGALRSDVACALSAEQAIKSEVRKRSNNSLWHTLALAAIRQHEQCAFGDHGRGAGQTAVPPDQGASQTAVPLAGKYRLVDIPISNCINSGLRRIYLLTQFNSASLHRHISQSYKFDHFSGGFVEILAAEQTYADTSWYQGTSGCGAKNLIHFMNHDWEFLLILSGDQLYRMDFARSFPCIRRRRRTSPSQRFRSTAGKRPRWDHAD